MPALVIRDLDPHQLVLYVIIIITLTIIHIITILRLHIIIIHLQQQPARRQHYSNRIPPLVIIIIIMMMVICLKDYPARLRSLAAVLDRQLLVNIAESLAKIRTLLQARVLGIIMI